MALDTTANVPASVVVTFPTSGTATSSYSVTVTLASLSLTQYAGTVGNPNASQLVSSFVVATYAGGGSPTNATALATLANQIATDFYLWRLASLEIRLASAVAWNPTGFEDIEWQHGQTIQTNLHRSEWEADNPEAQSEISVPGEPIRAIILAYDGAKYYSWAEIKLTSGGWIILPGGRSGTTASTPAVEMNGELLLTPELPNPHVLLWEGYVDGTLGQVYFAQLGFYAFSFGVTAPLLGVDCDGNTVCIMAPITWFADCCGSGSGSGSSCCDTPAVCAYILGISDCFVSQGTGDYINLARVNPSLWSASLDTPTGGTVSLAFSCTTMATLTLSGPGVSATYLGDPLGCDAPITLVLDGAGVGCEFPKSITVYPTTCEGGSGSKPPGYGPTVYFSDGDVCTTGPILIDGDNFSPVAAENIVTFSNGAVGYCVAASFIQLTCVLTTPAPVGVALTAIVETPFGVSSPAVQVGFTIDCQGTLYPCDPACDSFSTMEWTTPGTYTWTCPAGVTQVFAEALGGAGGGNVAAVGGGQPYDGGGGGGYGASCLAVTPGNIYTVTVGAGGASFTNGTNSSFVGDTDNAFGGGGACGSGSVFPNGGIGTGNIVSSNGGNGGPSPLGALAGGGGGAPGSYAGNGANGSAPSGSTGGAGGSPYGGAGGNAGLAGSDATGPGGGGGGSGDSVSAPGGAGYDSYVKLTWCT